MHHFYSPRVYHRRRPCTSANWRIFTGAFGRQKDADASAPNDRDGGGHWVSNGHCAQKEVAHHPVWRYRVMGFQQRRNQRGANVEL